MLFRLEVDAKKIASSNVEERIEALTDFHTTNKNEIYRCFFFLRFYVLSKENDIIIKDLYADLYEYILMYIRKEAMDSKAFYKLYDRIISTMRKKCERSSIRQKKIVWDEIIYELAEHESINSEMYFKQLMTYLLMELEQEQPDLAKSKYINRLTVLKAAYNPKYEGYQQHEIAKEIGIDTKRFNDIKSEALKLVEAVYFQLPDEVKQRMLENIYTEISTSIDIPFYLCWFYFFGISYLYYIINTHLI